MLPSHRRAIADILACRTHALGGHLWRCNHCSTEVYSYHSCKNRSCPRCHKDQTERWIAAREAELLACPYFHVTITVPGELREALRANQRDGYAALMKATAEAIIELARDRRHVGGTVGMMAVLHTWTQQLFYHPHVHCLVTGGGVSDDRLHWHPDRDQPGLHSGYVQSNRVSASATLHRNSYFVRLRSPLSTTPAGISSRR